MRLGRILTAALWLLALVDQALCSISCLNNEGSAVDWWVVLKVPGKINKTGYGYYDSKYSSPKLTVYSNPPDQQFTAMWRTLDQINSLALQVVAWNDENPNGTVSSSLAHSKTVIGVHSSEKYGFMMVHSIPKYPAFVGSRVNHTINGSQLIYGQHALCMTVPIANLEAMAAKLLIIHPDIYFSSIANWSPNLYRLGQKNFGNSSNSFENYALVLGSVTSVKSIYKNNVLNCSIFEDGLNNYLKSKLQAQTWGRPLQAAWCSQPYPVVNVKNITLATGYVWTQTDDHSKWVLTDVGYSCFGDMNRMTSQWRRGGAFYCISSEGLLAAMKAIVKGTDAC